MSATSSGGIVTLTLKAQYTSQVGFQVSGGMGCDGLFSPCSFSEATTPQGMITGNFVSTTPAVYDSGTVTAAISNLPVATYTYGGSDTPSTIASGLAAAINSKDSASATAVATTVQGVATVQVSSKATGYGINWPITLSTTYSTSSFKSPSFSGTTTNVAGGYPAVAGTTGGTSYTQFVYSPDLFEQRRFKPGTGQRRLPGLQCREGGLPLWTVPYRLNRGHARARGRAGARSFAELR